MKELAVVYATKYGHTKQYAEWIKEETGADIFAVASFSATRALEYKAVIFAGGVYGDKILIMDWLKKNLGQVNVNKMVIAAVSWYNNDSEEAKAKLIEENYPEQFKNVVPLIVINSGIDKKQTNMVDKAQLLAAQSQINKHEIRSADDINALAIIKGYSDSTSKDNLKSVLAAAQDIINPPKKVVQKPVEQPKPVEEPKPIEEPKLVKQPEPIEEPKPIEQPEPTIVSKPTEQTASSGEHIVTSLDDALAALSSGNMLLNRPPVHKPAQNTVTVNEVKVETPVRTVTEPEPVKEIEVEVPVQTVAEPEPVKEIEVEIPVQTVIEPEPAKEIEVEIPVQTVIEPELVKEIEVKVPVQTIAEPEPVKVIKVEIPVQTVAEPEPITPIIEEENDNVLSIADDIAEFNEPKPFPVLSAPKPTPAPAPKPTAPKHNSYMDLFAKKKPEAAPQPVAEPVYDPTFDASFTSAPVPAPSPAPVGMDFDFDILGTESSTANKTSTRALNAVEDLAKAKAKAEAEKLKQQKELEEKDAHSDNSYDIINNSIDSELTDNGYVQSADEPSYSNPSENTYIESSLTSDAPNIGNIDMNDDDEDTYSNSADDFVVEDYNEYEIENLTVADLLVPEEPVQQSSHKRTDFLKLQQEIEESIELNRKIRDKERTRNMRESERKAFEEAEKNPKKGIKQPEDADVFFKRPGKDYYSSDSMPEIKFNRHGR